MAPLATRPSSMFPWHFQAAYLWLAGNGCSLRPAGLHDKSTTPQPTRWEWSFAVGKPLLGVNLFWGGCSSNSRGPISGAWLGPVGELAFLLRFGCFHLLRAALAKLGHRCQTINELAGAGAQRCGFLGPGWSDGFRKFDASLLFQPLTSQNMGPRWSMVLGFGMSGLVHDLVISVPTGGGCSPADVVLSFARQRSAVRAVARLGRAWQGWLLTMLIVVGPLSSCFIRPSCAISCCRS